MWRINPIQIHKRVAMSQCISEDLSSQVRENGIKRSWEDGIKEDPALHQVLRLPGLNWFGVLSDMRIVEGVAFVCLVNEPTAVIESRSFF